MAQDDMLLSIINKPHLVSFSNVVMTMTASNKLPMSEISKAFGSSIIHNNLTVFCLTNDFWPPINLVFLVMFPMFIC